jgi:hypothetical protein
MERLNAECERFVVQAIAANIPLQEISRAVNVYFTVDLSEEELRLYDPTHDLSPERLSPYLIRLFAATRACYRAGIESWADECAAGYGTKTHRLAVLQRTHDKNWDDGDTTELNPRKHWIVLNILEEARLVANDLYEQGGNVLTGDVRMIQLMTLGWDVDELLKDYAGDDS